MSIDDRDLEMTPRRSLPRDATDDGGNGNPFAAYLGGVIILAIIGAAGFGLYKFFTNLPESPGEQKANLAKRKPARETEFIIKSGNLPKPADGSRYSGMGDAYILRPVDAARKLVGEMGTNRNTELDQAADSVYPDQTRSKAEKKKKGPPGPGCTVKDVQDFYERLGMDFLDLPADLVWGYDPETGKVYMAMR